MSTSQALLLPVTPDVKDAVRLERGVPSPAE